MLKAVQGSENRSWLATQFRQSQKSLDSWDTPRGLSLGADLLTRLEDRLELTRGKLAEEERARIRPLRRRLECAIER